MPSNIDRIMEKCSGNFTAPDGYTSFSVNLYARNVANAVLREVRDALNETADGEGRVWMDFIDEWFGKGGRFEIEEDA